MTVQGDLSSTLPELRAAGLRITHTLVAIGLVTGTVDDDDGVRALSAMPGVTVEPEGPGFQLPAPGTPQ